MTDTPRVPTDKLAFSLRDLADFHASGWTGLTAWRALKRLRVENAAIRAENDALKADIGPPGRWVCPTCGFMLTRAWLRAADGAVAMDARPVEDICTNDGASLRRVTWKEDAEDANRVGVEQMRRADAAEASLTALRQAAQALVAAIKLSLQVSWAVRGCVRVEKELAALKARLEAPK